MRLLQLLSIAGIPTLFAGYELAPTRITKVDIRKEDVYPGSELSIPTGTVTLSFYENKSVLLAYDLQMVPECSVEQDTPSEACGIHIHRGTSCAKAKNIGGHLYYGTDNDPWLLVHYNATKSKTATGKAMVHFGGFWEDAIGQVLVIHNKDENKITCSEIGTYGTNEMDMADTEPRGFSRFPGYQGPLKVTGFAHVEFIRNLSVQIQFRLDGVEGKCEKNDPSTKNSCGLHIHEGYSCDNAGEHFYNTSMTTMMDPWAPVVYMSTGDYASGTVDVDFGYNFEDAIGRVLVVHDYKGQKIACAIIGPDTLMAYVPEVGFFAPGYYTTQVIPHGSATVRFKSNKQVTIEYDLTDVDQRCSSPNPTVPNSCGIHIHTGYSCDTLAKIGEHYYRFPVTENDPWKMSHYSQGHGSTTVNFRALYEQAVNRVLILHDYNGEPATCVVIKMDLPASHVPDVGTFPDYSGKAKITGRAVVDFHANKTVTIDYALSGTETQCSTPGTADNSCGIHIHAGFSCDNVDLPGGHYYEPPVLVDPWHDTVYTSRKDGSAVGSVNVMFGATEDQAAGRVLIIHDYSGTKATCVVVGMKPHSIIVPTLGRFPEYGGMIAPTGSANLIFHNNKSVTIDFMVQGVDPKCSSPGGAANSCGIHIHAGYSCDDPSHVGDHYFASEHDPWGSIVYTAQGTAATGSVTVDFGFTFYDAIGRVLVLHDWNGFKATCVVIGKSGAPAAAVAVPALGRYPGFTGKVPSGSANLTFYDTSVLISYDLTQVDPNCDNPSPNTTNSCGIHIHQGTQCDDAGEPGEHYYLTQMDPWLVAMYIAKGTSAKGTVQVDFGGSARDAKGRVLVLHDWNGTKITCMPIGKDVTVDVSTFGKYPGYTGTLAFKGSVKLDFTYNTESNTSEVNVHYNLSGVEDSCKHPMPTSSDTPYSCGVHIHSGFSCDDPNLPGPVWGDDWGMSQYITSKYDAAGHATGNVTVQLKLGDSIDDGSGRVFVLHSYQGDLVTCIPIASEYEPLAACDSPSSSAAIKQMTEDQTVSALCEGLQEQELVIKLPSGSIDASSLQVTNDCKASSVRFFPQDAESRVEGNLEQAFALPKLLSYCNISFVGVVDIQSLKKGPRLLLENIAASVLVIDAYDFATLSNVTVSSIGKLTSTKLLRVMNSSVDFLTLMGGTPSSKVEVVGLSSGQVEVKDLGSAYLSGNLSGNMVDSPSIIVQNVQSVQLEHFTFSGTTINISDDVTTAELRNCVVENVKGQVALMAGPTNLALVGSTFKNNQPLDGTGPVQTTSATVVVDNCMFSNQACDGSFTHCARDIAVMSESASLAIKSSTFKMSSQSSTFQMSSEQDSSASLYYTGSVTVDKRNFTVDVARPACLATSNFVSIDYLEPCMPCQAGTYGTTELNYCTYCEKNQQSAEGASQCTACTSGKSTMGKEGMAECTMCSGNMYGKNCEKECRGIFAANKSHTACVLSIKIMIAIIAGVLVSCGILIFVVVFLKRQRAKEESEQYDILANDAFNARGSLNSSGKNKQPGSSSSRRQKKEEEKKT